MDQFSSDDFGMDYDEEDDDEDIMKDEVLFQFFFAITILWLKLPFLSFPFFS